MNWFRLKGCAKCGGDLVLEELDWLCLQCGTYYYTGLYQSKNGLKRPGSNGPPPRKEKTVAINLNHSGLRQVMVSTFPGFNSLIPRSTDHSSTTSMSHRASAAFTGAEA